MAKAIGASTTPTGLDGNPQVPQSCEGLIPLPLCSPGSELATALANPTGLSEDEQVSLLQRLHQLYVQQSKRLEAEETLLEALAVRSRQRPATPLVLAALKDLCAFYQRNSPCSPAKALITIEIFAGDGCVPPHLRLQMLKGKADLLYFLENKPAAYRLLKKIALKAVQNGFDFGKCIETDQFFANSGSEEVIEAGNWALLRSMHAFSPSSADYVQILERSLVYYSTHSFNRSEKVCFRLKNAIKRLSLVPDTTIIQWITHLRSIRSKVLDNYALEDCILEALVHITSLMQVNRGCYAFMSWWHVSSKEQFMPERGAEAVPQLLSVWQYEKKHARLNKEERNKQVQGWLVAINAFDMAESVGWREVAQEEASFAHFRRVYL
jgi:hypothetical protein